MAKKQARRAEQMEALNTEVMANLSIEELEQRLEMQVLSMPIPIDPCKVDCGTFCKPIVLP
jgi:hypothetical protein